MPTKYNILQKHCLDPNVVLYYVVAIFLKLVESSSKKKKGKEQHGRLMVQIKMKQN